jgi:hypothetical protein
MYSEFLDERQGQASHSEVSRQKAPRLLFLMNFWAQFYITANYGFEAEYLASAKDLFSEEEAELAVQHGKECLSAANQLRYLEKEKLAYLISTEAG